jgi:hypothetical protein
MMSKITDPPFKLVPFLIFGGVHHLLFIFSTEVHKNVLRFLEIAFHNCLVLVFVFLHVNVSSSSIFLFQGKGKNENQKLGENFETEGVGSS